MYECFLRKAREPWSSLTHLYGAVLSAAGLGLLAVRGLLRNADAARVLSAVLFGISLVALYTASSIYHYSNGNERRVLLLRKLDHAMIYVLIAGTYTPVLLCLLPAPRNIWFTVFIWGFAAVGIALKLCWFGAPRWLQTALYLAMGWAILLDPSVFARMPSGAVALLVLGGMSYTAGAVIYLVKRPNPCARFGFHELFHLLVLLGSLFHYLLVFFFIL